MKKIIFALFFILFMFCDGAFAASMYNAKVNSAIQMYKNRNYTECLQVMLEVVQKDPSNVLAYYYIAISEARLGNVAKAEEAYQRVIDLNTSTQLSKYSQNGIECLKDATKCKSKLNLDPSKKAMDSVNAQMEANKIESIKDIVNQKKNVQEVPVEYMRNLKDYSLQKNQLQNKSEVPTKEEIADALDTLKRAGYQPYMPQPPMTPEQIKMSMLNSVNNATDNTQTNPYAMPYMNNMEDMSKVSPEMLQTMMMGSMMNGMYSGF